MPATGFLLAHFAISPSPTRRACESSRGETLTRTPGQAAHLPPLRTAVCPAAPSRTASLSLLSPFTSTPAPAPSLSLAVLRHGAQAHNSHTPSPTVKMMRRSAGGVLASVSSRPRALRPRPKKTGPAGSLSQSPAPSRAKNEPSHLTGSDPSSVRRICQPTPEKGRPPPLQPPARQCLDAESRAQRQGTIAYGSDNNHNSNSQNSHQHRSSNSGGTGCTPRMASNQPPQSFLSAELSDGVSLLSFESGHSQASASLSRRSSSTCVSPLASLSSSDNSGRLPPRPLAGILLPTSPKLERSSAYGSYSDFFGDYEHWMNTSIEADGADARTAITAAWGTKHERLPLLPGAASPALVDSQPQTPGPQTPGPHKRIVLSARKRTVSIASPPVSPRRSSMSSTSNLQIAATAQQQRQKRDTHLAPQQPKMSGPTPALQPLAPFQLPPLSPSQQSSPLTTPIGLYGSGGRGGDAGGALRSTRR